MKIKVVAGAVIEQDGKILLVKEAQPYVYGKWNFPAGHLDDDEDLFYCAIREVKEETNLDVKLVGLVGVYERKNQLGQNVVKFIYAACVVGGELKHQEGELLDAKWFTFEEFGKLKDEDMRTPDMRDILNDYRNRRLVDLDTIRTYF